MSDAMTKASTLFHNLTSRLIHFLKRSGIFVQKHKVISSIVLTLVIVVFIAIYFSANETTSRKNDFSMPQMTILSKTTLESTVSSKGVLESSNATSVSTDLS